MFEIQVLDDHGQWRDDLVSGYTEDNRFATVADARDIGLENERVRCTACNSEWDLAFLAIDKG